MKEKRRNFIRRADIAVIMFFLLLSVVTAVFGRREGKATAEIISSGELLYTIELDKVENEYIISLDNGMEVKVKKDAIGFVKSDCTGKNCIKCGMLSSPGQTAVCIPNKTVIKLRGKKPAGLPDTLTY